MRLSFLVFLLPTLSFAADEPLKIVKTPEAIEFYHGNSLVTRYHIGAKVAKPYCWPINAPGDIPITRAWPMEKGAPNETTDHVHQKSAWFCHGDVIPEGLVLKVKSLDKRVEGVDFWSETPGHGRIVCKKVGEPQETPGMVRIETSNEWQTNDGMTIMTEERTISLQRVANGRLISFDIDLHASVCPITFGDTKEGSMGVRVSDEVKVAKGNGKYTNADGKVNEKAAWGQLSAWCDYSGKVAGKEAGIAIFEHPTNQTMAAWHAREYGLMAANPFGRNGSGFPARKGQTELVKLAKGEHLKLKYAIFVHTGDTQSGNVADAFAKYAK
jgi:hypothetical protein